MSSDYRILVAIDLQSGTDRLLSEVQRFGEALNATVNIIHVAEPDPDFMGYPKGPVPGRASRENIIRASHAKELAAEHTHAQAIAAQLRTTGVRIDQALTVQGPTLETILDHARKIGADLLMLGSRHHGALYRLWYGSTAAGAAQQAPCAVLVVPVER